MVQIIGLEPMTTELSVLCSTNWAIPAFRNGAPAGIWTLDPRIKSPLLWPNWATEAYYIHNINKNRGEKIDIQL